jgi:uncharacterized protein YcgL (UPF0745 family)
MPKWKKDAKEFEVSINYVDKRGYSSSIPKPVVDILGSPETIKFIILEGDNSVLVKSGKPLLQQH